MGEREALPGTLSVEEREALPRSAPRRREALLPSRWTPKLTDVTIPLNTRVGEREVPQRRQMEKREASP